jgi:L-threonylcarbamoyladenylate synthase
LEVTAKVLQPTPENLRLLGEALRQGELVAMPTETVYGLAGNAFDENAVTKIFSVKERPVFDPLIVHVPRSAHELASLEKLGVVDASGMSAESRRLAELLMSALWPGPLTLILPRGPRVPDLVTSGLPTVGVRMPRHPFAEALIEAAGVPLAAPSANRFGRISPTTSGAVLEELGDRIGWVLEGGAADVGVESTIIGFDEGVVLYRSGGIPREVIEKLTGARLRATSGVGISAPGMLECHYAPGKPLFVLPAPVMSLRELPVGAPEVGHLGLLIWKGDEKAAAKHLSELSGCSVTARALSARGDMGEAARRFFAELRFLDSTDALALYAEPAPSEEGLGHAIADRLRRASARRV